MRKRTAAADPIAWFGRGTLAGLPMIAGPIMGFVLWATPVEGVRAIALATLVCLPATVAHLVSFAWSGTRWPWWLSLALANLAFFGLGMLMPQLGQAVEPAQVDSVTPWWRGVETADAPLQPLSWPKHLAWPAD